jgi:pyruvate/2-oxoglutarate dehydrogenase complex dihydrolipoamide dehydrogenase (E3) component
MSDLVTAPLARTDVDVVVIGSGSGGGVAAMEIAKTGRSIIVVESGRVGGECHYVACVPSKALLIAARHGLPWMEALRRRDDAADDRKDGAQLREHEKAGIAVLRGRAKVTGEHEVDVELDVGGHSTLRWGEALVFAPGSEPIVPTIPGLTEGVAWTSEQALSSYELPSRLLVMGGGAVGCELSEVYTAFGTQVTLVERGDRLLAAEQPWVGDMIEKSLVALGVEVRTGVEAVAVEAAGGNSRVRLSDESRWLGDHILLAGGRNPRTSGLGVDALGITPGENGEIRVDARCHVLTEAGPLSNVYAVGDITEAAPFTHTANAQARTVAAEMQGRGRDVQVHASPRVVYTEPTVWCVGLTEVRAREVGIRVRTAMCDLRHVERGALERVEGRFELIADEHGFVVGAAAVGPGADSWATSAQLAVQQRLTVDVLGETLFAFPSLAETVGLAARVLADPGY